MAFYDMTVGRQMLLESGYCSSAAASLHMPRPILEISLESHSQMKKLASCSMAGASNLVPQVCRQAAFRCVAVKTA